MKQFETLRRTRDGRLIDVSITASPIKDATGAVVGVSKVTRDITERKQAAIALHEERERAEEESRRGAEVAQAEPNFRAVCGEPAADVDLRPGDVAVPRGQRRRVRATATSATSSWR